MPETTVEKITRNKGGSIILMLFGALMVVIIGFDFYKLFHEDASRSLWIKVRTMHYLLDINCVCV